MKQSDEVVQLTTRESQIIEGMKANHAAEVAELKRKIEVLNGNQATYKTNQQHLTERVVELQNKLLLSQESVSALQDRLLSLRTIINEP